MDCGATLQDSVASFKTELGNIGCLGCVRAREHTVQSESEVPNEIGANIVLV